MFQRRHYIVLADWVARQTALDRAALTVSLGNMLADKDPNFNWDRWRKACNLY